MAKWLGFRTFTDRAPVQSLVRELRSCKPHGAVKKKVEEIEWKKVWKDGKEKDKIERGSPLILEAHRRSRVW